MIILDTNVLSEMMHVTPSETVVAWFTGQLAEELSITSITVAEILFGLGIMPPGQPRVGMQQAAERLFEQIFEGHILPFDYSAANEYATLTAARQLTGKPRPYADMQIAAIALANGAQLATRNIRDFEDCGVTLINPWLVQ